MELQDPVPRVGKLGVLYARPGQRVLVDQGGDMQVRPTPLDIRLSSSNPGQLIQVSLQCLCTLSLGTVLMCTSPTSGVKHLPANANCNNNLPKQLPPTLT